jgi:outer membrane protein assembly factor BamA
MRVWRVGLVLLVLLALGRRASAQTIGELTVGPPPDLSAYAARPLDDVRIEYEGTLFRERQGVVAPRPGDLLRPVDVRRGLRELEATGRYASVRAELIDRDGRLELVYRVVPRRLIVALRSEGGVLGDEPSRRALGLSVGDEVTEATLHASRERLVAEYARAGYPTARVELAAEATDDPLGVLVRVRVEPGPAERVSALRFRVSPSPHHPDLLGRLESFDVRVGQRLDRGRAQLEAEALVLRLVAARYYQARVEVAFEAGGVVELRVWSGPRFSVRVEGHESFAAERIIAALELEERRETNAAALEPLVRDFYVKSGFLDASIRIERHDAPDGLESELYVWVREGARFAGRTRRAAELEREVDGVLSEQFPSVSAVDPVHAEAVDAALGSRTASPRRSPLPNAPYSSYSEPAYEAVRAHLRDLYRAEGFLDAEVGRVTLVRRRCARHTQPGVCVPLEQEEPPPIDCSAPPPAEPASLSTCTPDPARGVRCEPSGTLVLPIFPGRQAMLYDVDLEGNARFSEAELIEVAGFELGAPVRVAEIDLAIQRLREHYAEEGYAFAEVDSALELSPDRTRARLLVSITEREQVYVERIEVRGATRTREPLIRRRLALEVGDRFRRSQVERSERQLDSLGVFTSAAVALEDPGVPARRKVVVVTVTERLPQYLDIKGGFATADGFRVGFEYGHRNLGGQAIALTLRSQLAIRPTGLIPEDDVRARYEAALREGSLNGADMLERRNTLTVGFPEIGLGPLFRFEVELLDVRDNNRDFGLTRDAGVVRLAFLPARSWWMQLGATVERNDAAIIGAEDQRGALEDYVRDNEGSVRVPEGVSLAVTQSLSAAWDRRDKPLAATEGTYLGAGVEHVNATPLDQPPEACVAEADLAYGATCSELFRWTGRISGYVPLGKRGLSLAVSLRSGVITHLRDDSRTYTDRLFFLGGVDSLRGFPQDSLVPQDLADRVLDPDDPLPIESIVLRGGDFFINPRVELRIPLVGSLSTALFVDAGNLWTQAALDGGSGVAPVNPLDLRYTVGTGARVETPVGPLVFDYGFNVSRVLDGLVPSRQEPRFWEDLGAFHFSIGLF